MDKSNKPDGYYDEIEITASKKDDLLVLLKDYEVDIFTNKYKDFDYLEDNDLMLVVKNPFCDNTLDIELAGEFSVFFAGWHSHYFTCEYDYCEMKKDILGILNGNISSLVLSTDEGWLGSTLCKQKVSQFTDVMKLLNECWSDQKMIDKLLSVGGKIDIISWNPCDTLLFRIPKANKGTE